MNIIKSKWIFNMTIELHLEMSPITGKPICSNMGDYIIPEKYRKWCKCNGHQYQYYILELDNEHHTSINPKIFLENYPEWDDIKDNFDNDWTEDDHNEFKIFIEYLSVRPEYIISWSH